MVTFPAAPSTAVRKQGRIAHTGRVQAAFAIVNAFPGAHVDLGLANANTQIESTDPGVVKGKFS